MDWTLLLEIGGALIGIITAIYGVTSFIDWRIEKKIHEEPFLRKIAGFLRPMVIFNEHGSILLDHGAMEVLENITVVRPDGGDVPEKIIIQPKRHLAYAPILQTLENELINVEAMRGKGHEWQYQLEYVMYEHVPGNRRFRLEILV